MLVSKRMHLEREVKAWLEDHNAPASIFNVITALCHFDYLPSYGAIMEKEQVFELERRKNAAKIGFELVRLAAVLNIIGLVLLGGNFGYILGLGGVVLSFGCAWFIDGCRAQPGTWFGDLLRGTMVTSTVAAYFAFFSMALWNVTR